MTWGTTVPLYVLRTTPETAVSDKEEQEAYRDFLLNKLKQLIFTGPHNTEQNKPAVDSIEAACKDGSRFLVQRLPATVDIDGQEVPYAEYMEGEAKECIEGLEETIARIVRLNAVVDHFNYPEHLTDKEEEAQFIVSAMNNGIRYMEELRYLLKADLEKSGEDDKGSILRQERLLVLDADLFKLREAKDIYRGVS